MKKNNHLRQIFENPISSSALLLSSIGNSGGSKKWIRIISTGTVRARKKFSQDIIRMKSGKLIETKIEDKILFAKLTDCGVVEYLKLRLLDTKEMPKNSVCLVIFDIPEKEGELRRLFRRFLDRNYFIFIQKSVWISRFDISSILDELLVHFDIKQWVKIYIGKESFLHKRSDRTVFEEKF